MIVRFESFEEVKAWYSSHEEEYMLLSYKFTGGSKGESPSTSSQHSMYNHLVDTIAAGMDGFSKRQALEILY